MILIFGGTTEGRAAVEALDAAGKPYYYSTRGATQQIVCKNGIRLHGDMDAGKITACCLQHQIGLLIDAAHPFAEQLHRNIAIVSGRLNIPVVRYERIFSPRNPEFIWCDSYGQAVDWLKKNKIHHLLALSGVQTIPKLKAYWTLFPCWFRVLDRMESRQLAIASGFPEEKLVCFEAGREGELLDRLQPEAILTKESGETGFFDEKVQAAVRRHIPVVVIKRPQLPESFYVVTGNNGLRHRVERLLPGFFPLNSGYTTGSCACAAAKAALIVLLNGEIPETIQITLPCGEEVELPVAGIKRNEGSVSCTVIKDAGDDPDVTHGREICATVSLCEGEGILFRGGPGVGRVTLPGLGLEVGEPAINLIPRKMMIAETEKILHLADIRKKVIIEISVPGGEELALKTFNPKLGITGGISIIGTSGVVKPFSSEAFIETVRKEMQVACALGCRHVVINSGAKSERILKQRFPDFVPQAFVHYGNYIGETLFIAREVGVDRVTMGIMIGKAVKLAEGYLDTHSRNVVMNREFIASLARESGCLEESCAKIYEMTLARELWSLLPGEHPFFDLLVEKCQEVCHPLKGEMKLDIILIPENC